MHFLKGHRGRLGKKGTRRYAVQLLRAGDTVRVRGCVDKARATEPSESKVLRVDAKGRLTVVRRRAALV